MSVREEKITGVIKQTAAEFISKEADRSSMITVTNAKISKDLKRATIFLSIYPEKSEESALNFIKRKRGDFKKFAKDKIQIKRIPFFDFEIDK
jgi:ribosome-binding factor A